MKASKSATFTLTTFFLLATVSLLGCVIEEKLPELDIPSETTTPPKENLHLPGVPSAAERSKRGIDLGRATEINLEKIEELFLHTIEQQKQIETQNKLIQQLLQRVQALENKE
jgi:hypothetical protein